MTATPASAAERDRRIAASLERWFGFAALRPLQREAIDAALDGRDALVVMPTGGGKSLCYQLPPLVEDRLALVVSPLIALMQDQVDGLRLHGVPAAAAHGNLSQEARAELRRLAQTRELRLLFVAPERLFQDDFLRWLARQDLASVAIDEAHCISQWGHDFRPEYRRLAELRERLPGVPFHAYTATATPRVRRDIQAQLRLHDPRVLVGTFDRPELVYRVLPRQDLEQQVASAIARHPDAAAIVYCISRKDTEALAAALRARGVDAAAYHAGLPAAERTRISADFRAERLHVVVATVAFGMGIDRSDVRLVVHAAMPKSLEHYQQETGRAGRDGLPAECLLLYSAGDAAKWRSVMQHRAAGDSDGADEAQLRLLQQMQRFAGGAACRHKTLSEYFGQDYTAASCGACDVCRDELEAVEGGGEIARRITAAVEQTGARFGAGHVIDVLRGSRAEKVLQRRHDELPVFGELRAMPAARLHNYVDQLVDAGVLVRNDGEYPTIALGESARAVLAGELQIVLRAPKAELAAGGRRRRDRDASGADDGAPLDAAEQLLFDALRALRRTIAAELGVPPYVVFPDTTLEELARVRPSSPENLLAVRGIGEKKQQAFGARFLAAIAAHCAGAGLALDATTGSRPPQRAPLPPRPATAADDAPRARGGSRGAAWELFAQRLPVDEVAARIGRAASTTWGHLAEWVRHERPASLSPWVDADTHAAAARALAADDSGLLKPVFDALGGTIPYDVLRIVATFEQSRGEAAAERNATLEP